MDVMKPKPRPVFGHRIPAPRPTIWAAGLIAAVLSLLYLAGLGVWWELR